MKSHSKQIIYWIKIDFKFRDKIRDKMDRQWLTIFSIFLFNILHFQEIGEKADLI